jgi:hypothetical protein
VLLDDHQARFLAEEDLIGGGLFDAGTAELIQDGQQGSAASPGLLGQAAELGHTGRLAWRGWLVGDRLVQEHGQEPTADRQADPFGLGRARKGGAAVVVQEAGVGEPILEAGDALPQGSDLIAQLLELLSRVVSIERVQDGLRITVESLSGQSQLAGALRDRPMGSEKHGRSVGDPEFVG